MYHPSLSTATSHFGARTVVALSLAALACLACLTVEAQQQQQPTHDGCKVECYPNTKLINGKGGVGKGENCRWILRTDGKAARLCDHIKCKKVCPNNQAASSAAAAAAASMDQQSAASDNMRIEQQTEAESPNPAAPGAGQEQQQQQQQSMGIMRQLHGNKLAKAPVPGVAGGKLQVNQQQQQQPQQPISQGGRRMAPTMPPAVQYDENDTPPPISRFLDISPEE